jgi:hypothetical protein
METAPPQSAAPPPTLRLRVGLPGQRALQVVLGLFWILDAALQFQPYMFGRNFVPTFIDSSADGQPAFLSSFITHIGNFLAPNIAVWNTFFAIIQLLIGIGLLVRPTVRPALALSFAWVLGVWVFGEGLGMVLTGTASALTGAPGSVLLYGLIGLMAWPRAGFHKEGRAGIASSAAARGIGGALTPLAVWAGYWVVAAVLFVLPDNRTTTSISSAIVGMAPGEPSWYARFLTSLGNDFHTTGTETAWVLAIVSLIIGLGPLVVRRPGAFLAAGALFATLLWVAGQGLVGDVFTGSSTDPNTGPLIVLLAAAMVPKVDAVRAGASSPLAVLLARSRSVAVLGTLAIGAAMAITATYPVAAAESAATAMNGMVMGGSGTAAAPSTSVSNCTPAQTGLSISGLDLNNTPYMIMSGNLGMDMNGADASAAAGLNTTKDNWHYTGPALPSALARTLLTDGKNGPQDIHMAVSGCAKTITAAEQINAVQYVQATSAAVSQIANPFEAIAAGYVAASPMDYPVVYYVNPTVMAANEAARRTLSPQHVDGLVFAQTPSGHEVLAAAMYILPATVKKAPMPYGALVQWHQRTAVCGPSPSTATPPATSSFNITGFPVCTAGTTVSPTPYTTMVWQVPVAGGPLAIQPPDIQIVEAATMGGST